MGNLKTLEKMRNLILGALLLLSTFSFSQSTVEVEENKVCHKVAFPNPASEVVNFTVAAADYVIYLFDISGKTVATTKTSSIDLTNLNSGLYPYCVICEDAVTSGLIIVK